MNTHVLLASHKFYQQAPSFWEFAVKKLSFIHKFVLSHNLGLELDISVRDLILA